MRGEKKESRGEIDYKRLGSERDGERLTLLVAEWSLVAEFFLKTVLVSIAVLEEPKSIAPPSCATHVR